MANLILRVPPEHADDIRRSLLAAHAARRQAVERVRAQPGDSDELDGLEVEIDDLEEALDQLGWAGGAGGAVEISAHPEVLSDAVHDALARALDGFADVCRRYWRGEACGPEAVARLRAVAALFEVLAEVQEGG